MMPIELIIFDLDGTLVDSSVDITNAVNYAIEPYGVNLLTVQETITFVGEGITRLMEHIIKKGRIEADRDLLIEKFLEHYSAHLTDNTSVYAGVVETLKNLDSYKKAVISNKREFLSVKILNDLGLLKYFNLVVGSDTTAEKKPSPIPVFYVLERLGIRAENAVMVGDSNFDIEAGKAAGVKTIAVTYGYRPKDMLKGADLIIDSMEEIQSDLTNNR